MNPASIRRQAFASPNWADFEGPNPSGRTWLDNYVIDPIAGGSTGIADRWTAGQTSRAQAWFYGDDIAAYNTSGYSYAVGSVIGTATLAYASAPFAAAA